MQDHKQRWDEPPRQPIELCIDHVCTLILRTIESQTKGGNDLSISLDEALRFHRGERLASEKKADDEVTRVSETRMSASLNAKAANAERDESLLTELVGRASCACASADAESRVAATVEADAAPIGLKGGQGCLGSCGGGTGPACGRRPISCELKSPQARLSCVQKQPSEGGATGPARRRSRAVAAKLAREANQRPALPH